MERVQTSSTLQTFLSVVPVLGALYGYFFETENKYTPPEATRSGTQTDVPGYERVNTPTFPRTTKTIPVHKRRMPGQADTAATNTIESNDSTDSTSSPSSNTEEIRDAPHETPSEDDTNSSDDPRPKFEKDIRTVTDSTKNTTNSSDSVDLDDQQFCWMLETNVTMADVGGMEEVKEELKRDVIQPMKENPEKAEKFDIPLPNLLLYGPPGTGKTHLAKALATELEFPMVNLSGSDVTSKWVNESSEKVGRLFDEAQNVAEAIGGAIIFLDELDAVLPERQTDSHGEDRKVVNEFLNRLQASTRKRVLFIGATNKRDDLDSAAIRNGRIDKEVYLGKPDNDTRAKIFSTQLEGRPHSLNDDEIEALADATDGVVAADIESIVNQAARHAAYEREADRIESCDFSSQIN